MLYGITHFGVGRTIFLFVDVSVRFLRYGLVLHDVASCCFSESISVLVFCSHVFLKQNKPL